MFTDDEKKELVERLYSVLQTHKAGKAELRMDLADLLADVTREFLKGKYNAGNEKPKKTGIVQTKDLKLD